MSTGGGGGGTLRRATAGLFGLFGLLGMALSGGGGGKASPSMSGGGGGTSGCTRVAAVKNGDFTSPRLFVRICLVFASDCGGVFIGVFTSRLFVRV